MQKLSLVALCFTLLTLDCSSPLPTQSGEIRLNEWKTSETARERLPTSIESQAESGQAPALESGPLRPKTWMGKPFTMPAEATSEEVTVFREMLDRLVKNTKFPRYTRVPLGPKSAKRIREAKNLIVERSLTRAYAWHKVARRLDEQEEELRFYQEDKEMQERLDPRAMSIRYVAMQRAFIVDTRALMIAPLEVVAQRLVNAVTRAVEHDEQSELSGYTTRESIALAVFCGDVKRMRMFVSDALASYNEAVWLHMRPERMEGLSHTIMPMTLHEWLRYLDGNRGSTDDVAHELWTNSGTSVVRVSERRGKELSVECRFPMKIRRDEGEPYVMTDVAPDILVPLVDGILPQL